MNQADEPKARTVVRSQCPTNPSTPRAVSCSLEAGMVARRLVLALVLGLLGVSILIVTAQAYVAQKTEDSLVDFDSGTFLLTGLLDIPERNIHSVQLLPIGLTGEWKTSAYRLPERLTNLTAIANGDILYAIGGTDMEFDSRTEVYASQMSLAGELTEWQMISALPEARAGMRAAIYRPDEDSSTLYVVGGWDSDILARDTVYRATLDNDTGAVGPWETDDQAVPHALYYAPVVEHDGALYVIGGYGGRANSVAFAETYYAPINADGSLDSFVPTASLPEPLYSGHAVVYDAPDGTDTLYYIGGRNKTASTFKVYFADFLDGGGLSGWQLSMGNLPIHLYAHSGVLINRGEIIVTGGIANALDPQTGISSTVKAALVDPTNPSFRLYDWCLGVPPPTCTIGAWQTGGQSGGLLPEVRAFHGTEAGHGYVYVIGGTDLNQDPSDKVFYGTVNGVGAYYSPEGWYRSDVLDLGQPARLLRLTWDATIGYPDDMGLRLQYQTSPDGEHWSGWSDEVASQDGPNNMIEPTPPPVGIRYIQYQAQFTTVVSNASPLLNRIDIYYEVEDPDVAVRKDTGSVITAELGTNLTYTIHYTNSGGWVAEDVVLTETLPDNTTYAGGAEWDQVGATNLYTHLVGDLGRGDSGNVGFKVRVNDEAPPGVLTITNRVDVNYPPMIDAFLNTIVDPNPDDNWFEFENPLARKAPDVAVRKDTGSVISVSVGTNLTYTIYYTNSGGWTAENVVLTETLPENTTYAGGAEWQQVGDSSLYTYQVGDLEGGASGQTSFQVRINDEVPPDVLTIANRVDINYPPMVGPGQRIIVDPNPDDNWFEFENPLVPPMVDLTVSDIDWIPSSPTAGIWPKFYVTVENVGGADANDLFWVELYIKPHPSVPPQGPNDHDRGYCVNNCGNLRVNYRASVDTGLAVGGEKLVAFEHLDKNYSPDFPDEGAYDIYAQVDVKIGEGNEYWGNYLEADENNNVRWQGTLYLQPPTIYLPIVLKRWP